MITVPEHIRTEKPPEYDTCIVQPPTYDDAVQLSPAAFLNNTLVTQTSAHSLAPSYDATCSSSSAPIAIGYASGSLLCADVPSAVPVMATINLCHVTCLAPPDQVDK